MYSDVNKDVSARVHGAKHQIRHYKAVVWQLPSAAAPATICSLNDAYTAAIVAILHSSYRY
eukprot:5452-Heterococcus_DN1.PRE.2